MMCSMGGNYPLSEISALVREKSDHTPLFIDIGDMFIDIGNMPKSDQILRFENSWFLREGLGKIMTNIGIMIK